MKKPKMTTEDHREVGEHLHKAKEHLMLAVIKLREHYPKSGKIMKLAERACDTKRFVDLEWLLEADEGTERTGTLYFRKHEEEVMKKLYPYL